MALKLKTKGELFGFNDELSRFGRPVFEKDLDPGIIAEANRDGTTFVSKQATDKQKAESIPEEDNHHNQMMQGKLSYNHETVTWKQSTKAAPRVYKRLEGGILEAAGKKAREGAHGFPWEAEAKKNI